MTNKRKLKKRISIFILIFTLIFQTFTPIVTLAFTEFDDSIQITVVERVGDNIVIEGVVSGNPEAQLILEIGHENELITFTESGSFSIQKPVEVFRLADRARLIFGTTEIELMAYLRDLIEESEIDDSEEIKDPEEPIDDSEEQEVIEEPKDDLIDDPTEDSEEEEKVEDPIEDPAGEEIIENPNEDPIEEPIEEEKIKEPIEEPDLENPVNPEDLPKTEEIVDTEEELVDFIPSNPDNLATFDDSPQEYVPDYGIGVESSRMSLMANGTLAPGEVDTESIINSTPNMVNTWDVTLRVYGKDTGKTNDVVLVIDTSGSMSGERLTAAKNAANGFIDTLLGEGGVSGTRIAIVRFAEGSSTVSNFSSNPTTLKNAVNGLGADGGTHTQSGVRRARDLLRNNSTADYKNIVLLSDGEPTYSFALNNPDNYLIPYSGYGGQTGPGAPESAYLTNRVGNGSDLRWRYANPLGNSNDKYYNHGNSAIAEAGFAKDDGYTMYTVAMQAGAIEFGYLKSLMSTDCSYASRGYRHAYIKSNGKSG
jgi:hypothetical protein